MRKRIILGLLWLSVGCATQKHMQKMQVEGERLRVELAQAYISKGAYAAAEPLLGRIVREHPKDAAAHVLYGTVLRERKAYLQAEREFKAAIVLRPKMGAAYAGLGITYDLAGEPKRAQVAHRRSISLAPGNADFWNNLGFSLLAAGEYDKAVQVLERALALDPSLVIASNNLGFAYGRQKQYGDAWRAFRAAVGEQAAWHNLALVYEQNGDVAMASKLRADADKEARR